MEVIDFNKTKLSVGGLQLLSKEAFTKLKGVLYKTDEQKRALMMTMRAKMLLKKETYLDIPFMCDLRKEDDFQVVYQFLRRYGKRKGYNLDNYYEDFAKFEEK